MAPNEPSFYRLFRRSGYYEGPVENNDSLEAIRQREERERYAASAVAFCIKHSEPFRKHFWQRICKCPADHKAVKLQADGILLEPPHWADLRIIAETDNIRFVWVVELKAGAPLDPRQNPTLDEFTKPLWGYGALFASEEGKKNTRMRYIVLGARETLAEPFVAADLNIFVQIRVWEDLLSERPQDSLTDDLVASLGKLGIESFVMEKARGIRVRGGLTNLAAAWQVLEGVCAWLGLKREKRIIEAFDAEQGRSALGVYVKPPGQRKVSQRHQRLANDTEALETILWFGYFSTATGRVWREVWFYRNSEEANRLLLQNITKKFDNVRPERDDKAYCTVVASTSDEALNDLDWFVSVLKHVT